MQKCVEGIPPGWKRDIEGTLREVARSKRDLVEKKRDLAEAKRDLRGEYGSQRTLQTTRYGVGQNLALSVSLESFLTHGKPNRIDLSTVRLSNAETGPGII